MWAGGEQQQHDAYEQERFEDGEGEGDELDEGLRDAIRVKGRSVWGARGRRRPHGERSRLGVGLRVGRWIWPRVWLRGWGRMGGPGRRVAIHRRIILHGEHSFASSSRIRI